MNGGVSANKSRLMAAVVVGAAIVSTPFNSNAQPSIELQSLGHPMSGAAISPQAAASSIKQHGPGQSQSGSDLSRTMIDMSAHNAKIPINDDLGTKFGIELIFHRATIGIGNPDKLFKARMLETANAGYMAGAYHVIFPTHPGSDQADAFLALVKSACSPGQRILLAADWETVCIKYDKTKAHRCIGKAIPDPSILADFSKEVVKKVGKLPIVYTGQATLAEKRNSIGAELSSNPLWLATYYTRYYRKVDGNDNGKDVVTAALGRKASKAVRFSPRVGYVIPMAKDVYPWADWTFWQFGEGKGPDVTSKIATKLGDDPVDLNFFNGGRYSFELFFDNNAWDCKYLS